MNIQPTPSDFIVPTNHVYPPGNNLIFEDYFFRRFLLEKPETERTYLPILWTNFYISREYATKDMSDIQSFLNSIPRDKKYFTIVQWDDGILQDLNGIDIKICASGGVGSYPIPLNSLPHIQIERERDIFASFLGCISGRHRIREKMRDVLSDKPEYLIQEKTDFHTFKEVMERSVFSLCPRGYGKTSFRISEALNLGSIPVYLYDDPWLPFFDLIDFEDYGILIREDQIDDLDKILKSISREEINRLRMSGQRVYENFYRYDSCFEKIVRIIDAQGKD